MKKHPTFGPYIRAAREEIGFSLRRFAAQVGVSAAFMSKVELGETLSLNEETIRVIARELGKDGDFMVFLSGRVPDHFIKILMVRPLLAAEFMRHLQDLHVKERVLGGRIIGSDVIPPQFKKKEQKVRRSLGLVTSAKKGGAGTGRGKKRKGKKE